jgi:hypothetical protein
MHKTFLSSTRYPKRTFDTEESDLTMIKVDENKSKPKGVSRGARGERRVKYKTLSLGFTPEYF